MEESFVLIDDPRVSSDSSTVTNQKELKILYSKSKVYVHPSTNVNDFIPGYLSLVEKTPQEYIVAWTPEAMIPSEDMKAFVQVATNPETTEEIDSSIMIPSSNEEHSLYALSVPIDTIHSLLIKAPCFSKWYGSIVFNFKSGQSSGPFWFHDDESKSTMLQKNTQGGKFTNTNHGQVRWGGDEFIERLGQLVKVTKSKDTDNLYFIGTEVNKESLPQEKNIQQSTPSTNNDTFESTQMDPLVAILKEARWNILEKLSRVTKFSRDTAVNILSNPVSRPFVPLLPPSVQELCLNETVRQTVDEYDSARIFLAKWAAVLAAQSESSLPPERRYKNVGVWGHEGWEEDTALGVFEVLNSENNLTIPTHTRTKPVSQAEWDSYFDSQGKLCVNEAIVRKNIFCGGLEPSVRKEAWLFLTNVYPWDSTKEERRLINEDKRNKYELLKNKWSQDEVRSSSPHFQDQKHRIDKDVHRTDRTVEIYADENMPNPDPVMNVGTNENLEVLKYILCTYNEYNTELGYVQGMSDLLSPLFAVIGEEYLAFWAFSGFMDRMSNFYTDQSGMHKQLLTMDHLLQFMDPTLYKHLQRTDSGNFFFCFRWLLVWFKREFAWKDTLTLWEVLWTDYLTDKFHLFVALSILDQHRDIIIDYLKHFDEILKYTNDLSMNINLEETLQGAEILYYQFKQRVEAVENKREQLEYLISSKSDLSEQDLAVAKSDLSKLPNVDELLSDLLGSSYADKFATDEKQR